MSCSARNDFVDLGMSPLCESFLLAEQIDQMEAYFPLRVLVCHECFLVQLQEYVKPEHIFTEYAYFSSYSTSWSNMRVVMRTSRGPVRPWTEEQRS